MLTVRTPAKCIWAGEQFVHRTGAVVSAVDLYATAEATFDAALADVQVEADADAHRVFAAVAKDLQRRPLRYRVRLASAIPTRVGLGSSSALTVTCVALLRALQGEPFERRAIFEDALRLERASSGDAVSGVDTCACVYGGTHFYAPGGAPPVPLPHRFPPHVVLHDSGQPHDASCAEPLSEAGVAAMRALVARLRALRPEDDLGAMLGEAHALLCAEGLSAPAVDALVARLGGRAKVTGRGRGGCVLSLVEDAPTAAAPRRIVDSGVRVLRDTLLDGVPAELRALAPTRPLAAGDAAEATACSNIALVKYWGKVRTQIGANASVSLALPHCTTRTRVAVLPVTAPRATVDERAQRFAESVVRVPPGCHLSIETHNDFPTACGIASSASGFAALVRALAELAGVDAAARAHWEQQWARLGSGSAIRSACQDAGLVSWRGAVATAHPVHPRLRELDHALVVFDPLPKRVSSTDGHARAGTSPFYGARVATADALVEDVVRAFAEGDLATVRRVSEGEAQSMHMVMATSTPPVRYLSDEALAFVARFVRFRADYGVGDDAFYTIDAGSNVHLLFQPHAKEAVLGFVRACKCVGTLYRGVLEQRYRVVALSGKRYAGKTTLADALVAHAAHPLQVVHLSTAIKADYFRDEDLVLERARKEEHRARMIAHAERAREDDPHVWCRRAWETLQAAPTTILVTDVRRASDLAFWRAYARTTAVRVECTDAERARRGWAFAPGVDDVPSETGLDDASFDLTLDQTYDAAAVARRLGL